MEFLTERYDFSLTLLLSVLLTTSLLAFLLALLVMLSQADIRVEFSDLVSVLAGSGYLDWTSPVEVKVTESKSEML